jgi:serine/threonine protein kinase
MSCGVRTRVFAPRSWHGVLNLLERFDQAWQEGPPPSIEEFLPCGEEREHISSVVSRRALLEELVKIDMEYRWQRSDPSSAQGSSGPRVEDYLARFPELGPPERLSLGLIGEEYRVRCRWGDCPDHSEFASRFCDHATELLSALAAIDSELAADSGPGAREWDGEDTRIRPVTRLSVHCPHCDHPCDPNAARESGDITCRTCGGKFSVETTTDDAMRTSKPPVARVGRYVLRDLLGAGGFGTVWRGRDETLHREVAVKLPRTAPLLSLGEQERFLREARSAAQLHHPQIVAIHDVGRDGDLLYIVSELVRGESLAERLDRGRLTPAEATEIAAQVAEALDYAHREGVVHRDLKPSNILIDQSRESVEQPTRDEKEAARLHVVRPSDDQSSVLVDEATRIRARITDFGLAKREAGDITLTFDGQILGTPAYMSPEQISSPHAVDGRCDVYSLGVVLYQTLTGELPFRGTTRMLLNQVLNEEPTAPRKLNDKIPRDLETIVLKCIAKEPLGRYQSAAALADDLRRFQSGEPIVARPAGTLERAWRRSRRHPAITTLAAALVSVFVAGFIGVTWQWQRAQANFVRAKNVQALYEESFRDAHEAVEEYLTTVSESDQLKTEGLQPVRKSLLAAALKYYQRFLRQRTSDPARKADVASAYQRIGSINESIGSKTEALDSYRAALAIFDDIIRSPGATLTDRQNRAVCRYNMGLILLGLGDSSGALDSLQRARAFWEELVNAQPKEYRSRRGLAETLKLTGSLYLGRGEVKAAVDTVNSARETLEELARSRPADADLQGELAGSYNNLAAMHAERGDVRTALDGFNKAREIRVKLVEANPKSALFKADLAASENNLGRLQSLMGQKQAALGSFRKARDLRQALVENNPAVTQYRSDLAMSHINVGSVLHATGDRAGALASFEKAIPLLDDLVKMHPKVVKFQRDLATAQNNIGAMSFEQGNRPEALKHYREALAARKRLVEAEPSVAAYRNELASTHHNLGLLLEKNGQSTEAARSLREACSIREKLVAGNPHDLDARINLGWSFHQLGEILARADHREDAIDSFRQAADHERSALATAPSAERAHDMLSETLMNLGEAYRADHRATDAAAAALERRTLWPNDPTRLYNVACELAGCLPLLDNPAQHKEQSIYSDAAMEILDQAIARGFRDQSELRNDPNLEPLRSRSDFRLLEFDAGFPAKPFAR